LLFLFFYYFFYFLTYPSFLILFSLHLPFELRLGWWTVGQLFIIVQSTISTLRLTLRPVKDNRKQTRSSFYTRSRKNRLNFLGLANFAFFFEVLKPVYTATALQQALTSLFAAKPSTSYLTREILGLLEAEPVVPLLSAAGLRFLEFLLVTAEWLEADTSFDESSPARTGLVPSAILLISFCT